MTNIETINSKKKRNESRTFSMDPPTTAPAADGDAATAAAAAPLSKRAERREKRHAMWELKKEKKKQQRKDEKQAAAAAAPPVKELDMSAEAVLKRKERQIAKRESFLMAAEEGVNVVIDCEFEHDMSAKEKKSLSQQIMCVQ